MPLYVADYLADTAHLTCEESGAYLALIMHYWRTGALPNDDERLARIVKLTTDKWQCVRIEVAALFGPGWSHKRIDEELKKASEKSDKARSSANNRWKDKQKTNHANALRRHNARNADAMLSQPQPEPEKKEIRDADASLVNEAVDPSVSIEKPRDEAKALLKAFGEAWNQLAASFSLPQIDEIKPGSTRERHALARLREITANYHPNPQDGVVDLIARIRGSPYLRGEVNGFRCTFDWIVSASNFQKIMEGNYEDRKIASFRR